MYIRRPNYHHSDARGRPRDRHYRNGSYSSQLDRTNSSILHRQTSNSWYENSTSSSSQSTSRYGSLASAAVVKTPDSAYDTTTDRRTSETECSSKTIVAKTKTTRSGSESPSAERYSTTSRSNSRSPSSCSSTNSGSSRRSSSPASDLRRGLQSAVSTPASNVTPAVHSEDNRPLAICVRNLPSRSSDTSLKDGLFHEYKKHGKVTWVKVVGQSSDRYALVCFKKPEDVDKALEVSHEKFFFGCKIVVAPYQGFDVDDNEFRPYEAELDEYNLKATRTLFIGNLEKDVSSSELRKIFDNFGDIIEIEIKKQGLSAYAFIQYADIVSVVKAIRQMDGEHLGSNRVKLGFGKSMPTNCVWVDGVSDAVSESYLNTQFSRFGSVSQVAMNRERKKALVFFDQIQCAQAAVKEMRGVMLRNRKLQVDFASRECQDDFYDKKGATSPERPVFESARESSSSRPFDTSATLNSRFSRYDTPGQARTASFSRHTNSGAVSPTNSESTTPRSSSFVHRNSRYTVADFHDDELVVANETSRSSSATHTKKSIESETNNRRTASYDEFSQGSAASHDADDYNNCFRDRSHSPQTRVTLTNDMEQSSLYSRRKYDDEFIASGAKKSHVYSNDVEMVDRRDKSPAVDDEYYMSGSGKPHRVQSVVVPTEGGSSSSSGGGSGSQAHTHFQQPNDIRHLQKERSQLLEQLEECPSSGDEITSPKKRMKFESTDSSNSVQTNLANDINCDVTLNNHNDTNLLQHRKNSDVRRALESNTLKHTLSSSKSIRRPSTENRNVRLAHIRSTIPSHPDLNDQQQQQHQQQPQQQQPNPFQSYGGSGSTSSTSNANNTKRRRTGDSEHHSKGRGHQLHSHHSHEASAGESADGSRPGTPLCDERPEGNIDPRGFPRDRLPRIAWLTVPKFAVTAYQQSRAFSLPHPLSSYFMNHSSPTTPLSSLASPPAALLTRPTTNSSISLCAQQPQHSTYPQLKHQHSGDRSSSTHQSHQSTTESKSSHQGRFVCLYQLYIVGNKTGTVN